jgi:putative AdoMet-dependent methyltransferase
MPHAPHPDRRELFDAWSKHYDPASTKAFPFDSYEAVLDRVAERVAERRPQRVLELGVGTGALTRRLLERVPEVSLVGVDFSAGMAERASAAVPGVELVLHDLTMLPLPPETSGCDVAAMTFVLHEFPEDHQLDLLAHLLGESMREGGACVVGDVCFPGFTSRAAAQSRLGAQWDREESYLALDVFVPRAEALGLRVESERIGEYAAVLVVSGAG